MIKNDKIDFSKVDKLKEKINSSDGLTYEEFVEMIRMEYILQKYFSDAEVNFELSTDEYNNTEDVLKNLFREGINGLYYNLPVEVEKRVNFKVIAKISDKVYESNSTIKLLPDRKEEDNA